MAEDPPTVTLEQTKAQRGEDLASRARPHHLKEVEPVVLTFAVNHTYMVKV